MIVHLVLFRPKPGATDAVRAAMLDALKAASRDIPSVRRLSVGPRVTHGAAYEALAIQNFPYAAIIEFEDVAGLQAYLQHPSHGRVGELFYEWLEEALVHDYLLERL